MTANTTSATEKPPISISKPKYRPMFMSTATEQLTDAIQQSSVGTERLELISDLLGHMFSRLLECDWQLTTLREMADGGFLRCVIASDEEDSALGNVMGRAREILFDVGWAAGHIADFAGRQDRPNDPLRGWDLEKRVWNARSTVSMIEAYFNNHMEVNPGLLWPDLSLGVDSILDSLSDFRGEIQNARDFVDTLYPVHVDPVGSAPVMKRSTSRKSSNATTSSKAAEGVPA